MMRRWRVMRVVIMMRRLMRLLVMLGMKMMGWLMMLLLMGMGMGTIDGVVVVATS